MCFCIYHTRILGQQQITAYRQDLCKKIILQDTFDFVRSDGIFSIPGGLLVHPECLRVAVSRLLNYYGFSGGEWDGCACPIHFLKWIDTLIRMSNRIARIDDFPMLTLVFDDP